MSEDMRVITEIADMFVTEAPAKAAERYGCGHINDTYRVSDERGKRYILQKINHNVFRDVEGLMRNIVGVTEYIAKRTEESNERLEVIPTADGKPYLVYKGGYYRMYNFIYGGVSIESRPSTDEMRISGMGFGRFQKLLDGYGIYSDDNERREYVIRFYSWAIAIVSNQVWQKEQKLRLLEDGRVLEMRIPVSNHTELLSRILFYGDAAEPVSPQDFVDEYRRKCMLMAGRYERV